MTPQSAVTLTLGDLIEIPGLGTRTIGAIDQARPGRYQVRLVKKFEPSVTIDVLVNPSNSEPPTERRLHSRNPVDIREDLTASLDLALGDDPSPYERSSAETLVASITDHQGLPNVLRKVLEAFGPAVYGTVLRFHIEAQTSLSGAAEVMSSKRQLAMRGLTYANLGWPLEVLRGAYAAETAPVDPDLEARLKNAVDSWRRDHAHATVDTAGEPSRT